MHETRFLDFPGLDHLQYLFSRTKKERFAHLLVNIEHLLHAHAQCGDVGSGKKQRGAFVGPFVQGFHSMYEWFVIQEPNNPVESDGHLSALTEHLIEYLGIQQSLRLTGIAVNVTGIWIIFKDFLGILDSNRVFVGVYDFGACRRHLVDVILRRQARCKIKELVESLVHEPAGCFSEEPANKPEYLGHEWHVLQNSLSCLSVYLEVVLAAQQIIVDPACIRFAGIGYARSLI